MIKKFLILILVIFLVGCSNKIITENAAVPDNEIIIQSYGGDSARNAWENTFTAHYANGEIISVNAEYRNSYGENYNCDELATKTGGLGDCNHTFDYYAEIIMTRAEIEEEKEENMPSITLNDGRQCEYLQWGGGEGKIFCYKDGLLVNYVYRFGRDYKSWHVQGYEYTRELQTKTTVYW